MLPRFEIHRAQSLKEACRMLSTYGEEARILAGGTDLVLELERGKARYSHMVTITAVPGLATIAESDGFLRLGANVTHRQVEASSLIQTRYSALSDACKNVGSVQIRNVATVAGNICTAAPSADTASPLLALGARVRLESDDSERELPLTEFFTGPSRTALSLNEVLSEIRIPIAPDRSGSAYIKYSRRKAMDLALVGVAAYVEMDATLSCVHDVRIALSTVAPTPMRAQKAESVLRQTAPTEENLLKAAQVAASECSPRSSLRATAEYRRDMVCVHVRRALQIAINRAGKLGQ